MYTLVYTCVYLCTYIHIFTDSYVYNQGMAGRKISSPTSTVCHGKGTFSRNQYQKGNVIDTITYRETSTSRRRINQFFVENFNC